MHRAAETVPTDSPLPEPPPRIGAVDADTQAKRAAVEVARVLQAELKARISGEVRFDRTSRMLYSTDASNYQIEPIGVVVPKSQDDAITAIELATDLGVFSLLRGCGSSLAGQIVVSKLRWPRPSAGACRSRQQRKDSRTHNHTPAARQKMSDGYRAPHRPCGVAA